MTHLSFISHHMCSKEPFNRDFFVIYLKMFDLLIHFIYL